MIADCIDSCFYGNEQRRIARNRKRKGYIYTYIYEILEKEKFIFARFKKEIFILQHFLLKKLKIAQIIIVEY